MDVYEGKTTYGTKIGITMPYGKTGVPKGRRIRRVKQSFNSGANIRIETPFWLECIREKSFKKKVEELKGKVVIAYPFTLKEKNNKLKGE